MGPAMASINWALKKRSKMERDGSKGRKEKKTKAKRVEVLCYSVIGSYVIWDLLGRPLKDKVGKEHFRWNDPSVSGRHSTTTYKIIKVNGTGHFQFQNTNTGDYSTDAEELLCKERLSSDLSC